MAAKSWLLIYDNVEDYSLLSEYLPPEKGSMIITTRYQWLYYEVSGTSARIELEKLSPDDSLVLFNCLRTHRHPQADTKGEEEDTRELLDQIDGLVLGIKQMAYYISSKRLTVVRFREKYDKMAKYILDHKAPSAWHTLGTLWSVQFKDIEQTPSANLLGLLSLCYPDKIPLELFDVDDALAESSFVAFCEDIES